MSVRARPWLVGNFGAFGDDDGLRVHAAAVRRSCMVPPREMARQSSGAGCGETGGRGCCGETEAYYDDDDDNDNDGLRGRCR